VRSAQPSARRWRAKDLCRSAMRAAGIGGQLSGE
jgi:hypothetical protein